MDCRQGLRVRGALLWGAILAIVATTGCSSDNKGKIEGTKWQSVASTINGLPLPAGALQLDFGADGSLTYLAGPQKYTGKYVLGSGSTVTLKLNQKLAGRKEHAEKVVITGDRLTMTDSDGTGISFTKCDALTPFGLE